MPAEQELLNLAEDIRENPLAPFSDRAIWKLAQGYLELRAELQAAQEREPERICGIVVGSSWHHPIACAFPPGHDGEHSWASIPQYAPTEKLAKDWGERILAAQRTEEPNDAR